MTLFMTRYTVGSCPYRKWRRFGSVKAPLNKGGRPRSITPVMLEELWHQLLEKPTLCLDGMAEVRVGRHNMSHGRLKS
jgi:hypothetical protein